MITLLTYILKHENSIKTLKQGKASIILLNTKPLVDNVSITFIEVQNPSEVITKIVNNLHKSKKIKKP